MNNNGRVPIYEPDTNTLFSMYDKIACNTTISEYREPLIGNWSENKLSRLFFSAQNIKNIQEELIKGVYIKSNHQYKIGYQCTDTLKIIM